MADDDDQDEGARRRDDGIERSDKAANELWKAAVDDAIHYLASRQADLTTDDVWLRMEEASGLTTREGRAMGARMKAAESAGWIRGTQIFRATERPSSNRRPIRVWRSKIYSRQLA